MAEPQPLHLPVTLKGLVTDLGDTTRNARYSDRSRTVRLEAAVTTLATIVQGAIIVINDLDTSVAVRVMREQLAYDQGRDDALIGYLRRNDQRAEADAVESALHALGRR